MAKLDHINFTVADFKESVAWYKKVFHFELVEEGKKPNGVQWGILRNGDSMLAISEYPDRKWCLNDKHHKSYHFGLRLVDQKEWEEKIKEHNLEVFYGGAISYPHSTSWYVKDPTGYEIEVAIWNNNEVNFS